MSNSKPLFGYWNIRGFGQPIRFLLEYVGVDYTEKVYIDDGGEKRQEWFNEKFTLGLDFPNVPYLIEGDFKLTEKSAILKYLAKKHDSKLMPKDDAQMARCEMLENVIMDVWQIIVAYAYISTEEIKKEFPDNSTAKLKQISEFIGSNRFSCGNELTYVDFFMYEVLYHMTVAKVELVKPFSNLMNYMKTFEAIPQISKYIQTSPKYLKGPCFSSAAIIKF